MTVRRVLESAPRRQPARLLLASALLAAGPCVACSSGDSGTVSGTTAQASLEFALGPDPSKVYVVIADDRSDAGDLRDAVYGGLQTLAARSVTPLDACARGADPSALRPNDRSLIVVHPSLSGDAMFTSPVDSAGLRWQEDLPSGSGEQAWLVAATHALSASAPAGAPFAALAATRHALDLLSGSRPPQTDYENALLASLPANAEFSWLLAAAHEDESTGAVSDYALSADESARFDEFVVPAANPSDPAPACTLRNAAPTARFAEWLAQSDPVVAWPCTGLSVLAPITADCESQCVRWSPIAESDGSVDCLILVDALSDHCDASKGWLDPVDDSGVRRPVLSQMSDGPHSTCEIQQLSGSALDSCINELSCVNCGSGWCATQVPQLLPACGSEQPIPFRFVGAAGVAAPGTASVLCNVTHQTAE